MSRRPTFRPSASARPGPGADPGSTASAATTPAPPAGARRRRAATATGRGAGCRGPDDLEDLSAFDESELGEIADFDNSAESRVMQAFPGAEEVG